jgi:PPK2 family polyphosphate:nucleotide phosphotransferase
MAHPAYRIAPGTRLRLADHDPGATEGYRSKKDVEKPLAELRERIGELQDRLYAEHRRGLLVVLQAMDTGGKDGTIKGVFTGANPQGCRVWSFKAPRGEELEHDFLWRQHVRGPSRGMVTVFNRSHYEDVLVPRVKRTVPEAVWRGRYRIIRDFEHGLVHEGMAVVKFFLHISKDEQRRRLQQRLADPAKRWKFDRQDIVERGLWDEYRAAYEDAISKTSTDAAPWYVVPADHKWFRNLVVARTVAATLEAMAPRYPEPEGDLEVIEIPD